MQAFITFAQQHAALSLALATVFLLLVVIELMRAKRHLLDISPATATQMINKDNAVVIDIRGKDAYKQGHIIDALSLPSSELSDNTKKIEKHRIKPLIIVCGVGIESQKVATALLKNGYNAYSLAGGMRAWLDAQMPVVKE